MYEAYGKLYEFTHCRQHCCLEVGEVITVVVAGEVVTVDVAGFSAVAEKYLLVPWCKHVANMQT